MSDGRRRLHLTVEPLTSPELEPLRRRLEADAQAIRAEFGDLLANPHVARQAARFMARQVAPSLEPGRPRSAEVTEALRLEARGVPRSVIYCRLGKHTRDQKHTLMQAVRQRKRRARDRNLREQGFLEAFGRQAA
jgi:hypothetical protein